MRRGASLLFVALLALMRVGTAGADDAPADGPPPEAKKAFTDGKAAFERGEYDAALQLFQRAVLIAPAPSLYYNIGMAYERLGRYEDSAIAFEKYLRLIDAPQTDEEHAFQTKLRERAAANRARAREPVTVQPTAPRPTMVEPPPNVVAPSRYPRYAYQPYLPAAAPPPSHRQKLDIARRHRNNGIALTVIGGSFLIAGIGLTTWAALAPSLTYNNNGLLRGVTIWGTASLMVVGVPLLVPGAIALGKWQKALDAEQKRPDDGADAARAALDVAVPPHLPQAGLGAGQLVMATPPLRF